MTVRIALRRGQRPDEKRIKDEDKVWGRTQKASAVSMSRQPPRLVPAIAVMIVRAEPGASHRPETQERPMAETIHLIGKPVTTS